MNCPNCGKENSPDEKFCEDCGAQLVVTVEGPEPDKKAAAQLEAGQKVQDRYVINSVQSWAGGSKYYGNDSSDNDHEVILFERNASEGSNPLKLQWDILGKMNDARFPHYIDYFESEGRSTLVMEGYSGESLDEIMKREKTPFEPARVAKWGIDLCDALGLIHKSQVLHRDLQPSNLILRPDDSLLIVGFDRICRIEEIPEECAVTPGFSAPEAYGIGEGKIDVRSDIYSIGATLYSLLTGKIPLLEHRETFFSFPPFSEYKIRVAPQLESAVMMAVNKKPESRFQSVDELKQALESVASSEEAMAQKPPEPEVPAGSGGQRALSMNVGMKTHIGNVREINQDSCIFVNFAAYEKSELKEGAILVVADGMGGEAEGEKASSIAIRVISKSILDGYLPIDTGKETRRLLPESVEERGKLLAINALKEANSAVFSYAAQEPSRKGMGSTISVAIIEGDNLVIGHAGDTRVYLMNDTIEQISEDHSLVGRLVKMGQLKKEEALRSPQRSLVYRALGTSPELEIDTVVRKLKAGDWILLCSDGVWEYYVDDEIFKIVREVEEPQAICEKLIETCLERGADDNCTAIVVRMGEA